MSAPKYSKLQAKRDESPDNARRNPHSDDEDYDDGRPSAEMAPHDREILEEEEERENLLSRGGSAGKFPALFRPSKDNRDAVKIGALERKRLRREARRERKGARNGESSELMYEMEEGVGQSDSDLSRDSSLSDQQRLNALLVNKKVCLSDAVYRIETNSHIRRAGPVYGNESAYTSAS
jgi:hypothetical protein